MVKIKVQCGSRTPLFGRCGGRVDTCAKFPGVGGGRGSEQPKNPWGWEVYTCIHVQNGRGGEDMGVYETAVGDGVRSCMVVCRDPHVGGGYTRVYPPDPHEVNIGFAFSRN